MEVKLDSGVARLKRTSLPLNQQAGPGPQMAAAAVSVVKDRRTRARDADESVLADATSFGVIVCLS
jgi:hypothetical protein